jgi:hypothetical protein
MFPSFFKAENVREILKISFLEILANLKVAPLRLLSCHTFMDTMVSLRFSLSTTRQKQKCQTALLCPFFFFSFLFFFSILNNRVYYSFQIFFLISQDFIRTILESHHMILLKRISPEYFFFYTIQFLSFLLILKQVI